MFFTFFFLFFVFICFQNHQQIDIQNFCFVLFKNKKKFEFLIYFKIRAIFDFFFFFLLLVSQYLIEIP